MASPHRPLSLALVLVAVAACGGTTPEEPNVPPYADIQRIFDGGCAGGACHQSPDASPPASVDLSPGVSRGHLVGQPSTTVSGRTLVVAGDPDQSLLLCVMDLECADRPAVHGQRPPPSPATVEAVRRWIAGGALGPEVPAPDPVVDDDAPVFAGLGAATASGEHAIALSWRAAVDRTPPSRLRYRVYLSTTAGGQNFAAPTLTVTGVTTASLEGLTAGTTYHVVVRAVDEADNEDRNSAERSAITADVTAPEFTGVADATAPAPATIRVTWAAATDNVTAPAAIRYRVYLATTAGGQDFANPTTTVTGATEATIATGLAPSTTYHVVVRAEDAAGNRDGNQLERGVRTLDTLAPTFAGVTGATGAAGAVQLTWAAGSDETTAAANLVYLVYRATSAGGQNFAGAPQYTTPPGVTSFAAGGLAQSTTYFFVVRARDEAGNVDGNTVERSATTLTLVDTTPPTFAGATTATATGATTIRLAWSAASDNTTAAGNIVYRIYRATTSGGQSFAAPTYTSTPGATSFIATGLSPQTRYYFVVRAVDQAGNQDANTVQVDATTAADTTAPTFAGLTTATPVNATTIALGWAAGTDDVSAPGALVYDVYRATTAGGQSFAAPTYTTAPGATSFVADGLAPATTYHFVVRARDAAGNRDANVVERMAATAADTTAPTFAGADAAAPNVQSGRLNVSWQAATDNVTPANQVVYLAWVSTNSGLFAFGAPPAATSAPGALTMTISGLAASTTYFVVVRARDVAGNVDQNTMEVSATTIADTTAPTFGGLATAVMKTPTSVRLTWVAASDDVTAAEELVYQVYVATSAGGENFGTPTLTTMPGETTAVVTGLNPLGTYFFVVRARDASANVEQNVVERSVTLPAVSLVNHVTPILQPICSIGGCHSGAMPSETLDLSSAAAIYNNTVNRPAVQCGGILRVQPGSTFNSYLLIKLTGVGACFEQALMPKVGSLSVDEIDTVRRWIAAGAPNN
jgi:hypothetical protein